MNNWKIKLRVVIAVWLGLLSLSSGAVAAPRMDTAVGTESPILATVVPDHENKDLYYVFPQGSEIVKRADNRFSFLYMETYEWRVFQRARLVSAKASMWIRTSIESDALKAKIAEIKAANPNAKFSVVTAFKTEVAPTRGADAEMFLANSCEQLAGPLESPVFCALAINPRMARSFVSSLKFSQATVLHYTYYFYGWNGSSIQPYAYSLPLRYGSLEGKGYFVDQDGHDLD